MSFDFALMYEYGSFKTTADLFPTPIRFGALQHVSDIMMTFFERITLKVYKSFR